MSDDISERLCKAITSATTQGGLSSDRMKQQKRQAINLIIKEMEKVGKNAINKCFKNGYNSLTWVTKRRMIVREQDGSGPISNDIDILITKDLLDGGANINALDKHGETPSTAAVDAGRFHIIELLKEEGADFDIPNKQNKKPFDIAIDGAALTFGEVQINGVKYGIDLPHGGIKQSGVGVDCSHLALHDYLAPKRISSATAA